MVTITLGIFTGLVISSIFDKLKENESPFYMYILTYIASVVIMFVFYLLYCVAESLLKDLPKVLESVSSTLNSL